MDAACKSHDLCYSEHGYFDPVCDQRLMLAISYMRFFDGECQNLTRDIITVFQLTPPARNRVGTLLGRIAAAPFVVGSRIIGSFWVLQGYPEPHEFCCDQSTGGERRDPAPGLDSVGCRMEQTRANDGS